MAFWDTNLKLKACARTDTTRLTEVLFELIKDRPKAGEKNSRPSNVLGGQHVMLAVHFKLLL